MPKEDQQEVLVKRWTSYLIWRLCDVDVEVFHPAFDEVQRHGRIEAQQRIRRKEKPLLLVRLGRKCRQPKVERREPHDKKRVRARFALFGCLLGLSESPVIEEVCEK